MVVNLDDGNWAPFRGPYEVVQGFRPNRVLYNSSERAAAIVIARALGRDFALGKRAFDYLSEALAAGKIDSAWVVLVERDSTVVVGCKPLREIEPLGEPIAGQWGPYWWLTQTFKNARQTEFAEQPDF
jgi:hypothetical protein